MATPARSPAHGSLYLRVLRNRTVLVLGSGQSISTMGDTFFNLAIMWIVYTQSGSALQTSLIQVVWQLDRIIIGPVAGLLADRAERKRIVVVANLLAAGVVGALATLMAERGQAPSAAIFLAVFLLNSLNTVAGPARVALLPEIVERDLLATTSGLFSTVGSIASLCGSALAGIVVAAVGAAWAVAGDAASFLLAALVVALAPLPARRHQPALTSDQTRSSFLWEIRDGWRVIMEQPVLRALVWLSMLINMAAFLGPLYPALVSQQLHGAAVALGVIEAAGVVGGIIGGAVAGPLERRVGAGPLLISGWGMAGGCTVGMAASSWLPLTAALEAAVVFGLTAGSVAMGAVTQMLVPERYRGRVWGLSGSVAVMSIPLSSLLGGWLTDSVGVAPLFATGGIVMMGVAALAQSNHHVRTARV